MDTDAVREQRIGHPRIPPRESGVRVAGTVTGQLAPETPFDEAYCHRAGHRSVGNHRL